jgi:hypothetical protein
MKAICLSILLLATSAAVADIDGVKPGGQRRRTHGVPGNNRALYADKLKGAKGMKDKKVPKGCQSLKIKALFAEFVFGDNAIGETLFFPVYDYNTDESIGTFTSTLTEIFAEGEVVDCVISRSYNLGFDESLEFPFEDQITIAASCDGTANAITGGTGEYACASGYGVPLDTEDDDSFAAVLTICNTCA